jgi:hypothetical protein
MKARIVRLSHPESVDFYALERPRWFRRSLWYSESWSEGGDLAKFSDLWHAKLAVRCGKLEGWEPINIENLGYERIG